MLVLEGRGAAECRRGFSQQRHRRRRAVSTSNARPSGRTARRMKVAFSLAFARDAAAPDAGFFTCQQHYPENFWNPAFQKHANSVSGIAGVVAVAAEPARHLDFMQSFAGAPAARRRRRLRASQRRAAAIEVTTPAAFLASLRRRKRRMSARGARLAALRFAAGGCEPAASRAELAGIAGLYAGNAAVIGPEDAMGAVLVFEPATKPVDRPRSPLHGRAREGKPSWTRSQTPSHVVTVGAVRFGNALPLGADRRALRAGKPGACAGDGGGAEGDRRPRRHRPRLQDLVRQGEPHVGQERARHRARRGAADLCRNPRQA